MTGSAGCRCQTINGERAVVNFKQKRGYGHRHAEESVEAQSGSRKMRRAWTIFSPQFATNSPQTETDGFGQRRIPAGFKGRCLCGKNGLWKAVSCR